MRDLVGKMNSPQNGVVNNSSICEVLRIRHYTKCFSYMISSLLHINL